MGIEIIKAMQRTSAFLKEYYTQKTRRSTKAIRFAACSDRDPHFLALLYYNTSFNGDRHNINY